MMRELKGGAYDHIGTFKKEGEALTPGEGGAKKVRNTSLSGGPQVGGIGGLPGMTTAASDGEILDLDATSAADVEAELEQSLEAMMSDIDSLLADDDGGGRGARDAARSRHPRRGRERPMLARERPTFSSGLGTKADLPTLSRSDDDISLDTSLFQTGTQQATLAEKPSERLRAQRRERPSLELRPPTTPAAAQPLARPSLGMPIAPTDSRIDGLLRSVLSASKSRVDRTTYDIMLPSKQTIHTVVRGWDLREEAAGMALHAKQNAAIQTAISSFLQRNPIR
jgi:hypothetical protein